MFTHVVIFLWISMALLVLGSVYLIVEGVKVHKLFADSIVGKLVKALVVVFLINLYSLGIVSLAFVTFKPDGIVVLLPIIFLWILTLIFAIIAIRSAKMEVNKLLQ